MNDMEYSNLQKLELEQEVERLNINDRMLNNEVDEIQK